MIDNLFVVPFWTCGGFPSQPTDTGVGTIGELRISDELVESGSWRPSLPPFIDSFATDGSQGPCPVHDQDGRVHLSGAAEAAHGFHEMSHDTDDAPRNGSTRLDLVDSLDQLRPVPAQSAGVAGLGVSSAGGRPSWPASTQGSADRKMQSDSTRHQPQPRLIALRTLRVAPILSVLVLIF